MTKLFDPPQVFELPVSKGGDLHFGFRYMPLTVDDGGEPVLDEHGNKQYHEADYPDGSSVQVVIDTDVTEEPIEIDADITGSMAVVLADKEIADTIKNKKLWRAVITYSTGIDKVMCNGTVVRNDGKAIV